MKKFIWQSSVIFFPLILLVAGINYFVDSSRMMNNELYLSMADLALKGNAVATPENYNERFYQTAVINKMSRIPETIVLGCSRGMFLGKSITGFDDIYNNCVSGAALEDYYAVLGLYDMKFSQLPSRIIMEISPWVFNFNPESRWMQSKIYSASAENFYRKVNNITLSRITESENPYFSIPYFQKNFSVLLQKGIKAFARPEARISIDESEGADYPDGSLRYPAAIENPSEERLQKVKLTNGPVTYQQVNKMYEIDKVKLQGYENLISFLINNGTEIIVYMSPFSVTQCYYIYDKNGNPVFDAVENYLRRFCAENKIEIIGGYDSRKFDISDMDFSDFMHLDKHGTNIVWNTGARVY